MAAKPAPGILLLRGLAPATPAATLPVFRCQEAVVISVHPVEHGGGAGLGLGAGDAVGLNTREAAPAATVMTAASAGAGAALGPTIAAGLELGSRDHAVAIGVERGKDAFAHFPATGLHGGHPLQDTPG